MRVGRIVVDTPLDLGTEVAQEALHRPSGAIAESADFIFLMRQTGLTRGNLSPNLRKLEEANYISIQKEFVNRVPRTLIRLTDEGRTALRTYRENMQLVLNELLDNP